MCSYILLVSSLYSNQSIIVKQDQEVSNLIIVDSSNDIESSEKKPIPIGIQITNLTSKESAVLTNSIDNETLANDNRNIEDSKIQFTSTCFYSELELCQPLNKSDAVKLCDCQMHRLYKKALYCCNVSDIEKALSCAGNLTDIQHLHIRNATMDEIDFSGI